MRKLLFFLIACVVNIPSTAQTEPADSNGYVVFEGNLAPDFEIELTDGTKTRLSDLRGKLVMLQFTASWCGVCRKEMPSIESDIWQKHKDSQAFCLIGIDRDEPIEKVIRFAETTGVTYPLGLDPGANIFAKYALREAGVTRNVLIDRNGIIIKRTRLYKTDEFNTLVETIEHEMEAQNYTTFSPDAFQRLIETNVAALLDVRTADEFAEGHLAGAKLANVLEDNFMEVVGKTFSKERPLAVYCRSGKRSAHAAQQLIEAGYQVYNLDGGILRWEKEGLPVVK